MKYKQLLASLVIGLTSMRATSQANTSLSNLIPLTAINSNLLPGLTNARDLGSPTLLWGELYINGAVFNGTTSCFKFYPAQNSVYFGPGTNLTQLGTQNTAIGHNAGLSISSGGSNVMIGSNAGSSNTIGSANTLVGKSSGQLITAGVSNACFGINSGASMTTGGDNALLGINAGLQTTSGRENTFLGAGAGAANTTGNFNTALGNGATFSVGNLEQATSIGWSATCNASQKVRIGASTITSVEGQVPFSFPSDGRFKTNVNEVVPGMDFIRELRPVTYNFQTKKFDEFLHQTDANYVSPDIDYTTSESIVQSGFIAQKVEQATKEIGYDFNGVHAPESEYDNYSMSYQVMVVPMVKAMQELNAENEMMLQEIEIMLERVKTLQAESTENSKH